MLLIVVALALTGCGLLRPRHRAPTVQIGSLVLTNTTAGKIELLEVLQGQVQRFADQYAVTIAQAADDYIPRAPSPGARIEAVRWKLGQATAAWVDASGPNPVLNILDLVVLAKVSRMVLEDQISRFGETEGLPLLEAQRTLETNLWAAVSSVISPDQRSQLQNMIEAWHRKNPGQRYTAITRFRELAAAVGQATTTSRRSPNSILSLLYLDPLAGLDPTAMAIQETRQLAERAIYYTQRMPTLLNWQVQLLTLQLAAQPESQQILSNAASLTKSTETFARVAEELPKLVNDQREVAIRQMLDGVASERTNLLAGLAAEEQKVRSLLTETRQTLEAGSSMATSVQAAVKSLDDFVHFVSPTNYASPSTNSKPFDVLEYGQAAGQVGLMARDLNKLLHELNQTTPELEKLRHETATDAERLLHRAFWLGAALSLVVLAGMVLAGLIYRTMANRLQRREPS